MLIGTTLRGSLFTTSNFFLGSGVILTSGFTSTGAGWAATAFTSAVTSDDFTSATLAGLTLPVCSWLTVRLGLLPEVDFALAISDTPFRYLDLGMNWWFHEPSTP